MSSKLTEEEIDEVLAGLKAALLRADSVSFVMERPLVIRFEDFGKPAGFVRSGPETYTFSIEYPNHYEVLK